jgi:hypothetical protein
MLCEFAHDFPDRIADILDRDKGLKRNFREEPPLTTGATLSANTILIPSIFGCGGKGA